MYVASEHAFGSLLSLPHQVTSRIFAGCTSNHICKVFRGTSGSTSTSSSTAHPQFTMILGGHHGLGLCSLTCPGLPSQTSKLHSTIKIHDSTSGMTLTETIPSPPSSRSWLLPVPQTNRREKPEQRRVQTMNMSRQFEIRVAGSPLSFLTAHQNVVAWPWPP